MSPARSGNAGGRLRVGAGEPDRLEASWLQPDNPENQDSDTPTGDENVDDDTTTPQDRTTAIIEQIETLEIIARRTMDLTAPVVDGSMARCVMLWRNPSRRIVLQTMTGLFNSAELDVQLEIRRPGNARRIMIEGASHDSGLLPRPSDPEGSVLRLLSAVKTAAERSIGPGAEEEEIRMLGMILSIAEKEAITDRIWSYTTGSEILGPGRLSTMPERGVSVVHSALPPTGGVDIEPGDACLLSMQAHDPKPVSTSSPAPLLCTIKRTGARIDLDRYGPEARLRALAMHLSDPRA